MRDIEFRMYDKANKKYFYGIDALERLPEWGQDPSAFGVVFEQYTGLKDKNGNKIFEDDILKNGDYIMRVIFRKDLASFALSKKGWIHDHFFQEAVSNSDCEIIGNIHDNHKFLR